MAAELIHITLAGNQSEKARREIEELYGLVRAERQQQLMKPGVKPVDPEKSDLWKT